MAAPPPIHVKLTSHFIEVARDREWDDLQAAELWRLIASGRLQALAGPLPPGERGAVAVAGRKGVGAVVFMRDDRDPSVLAVLTYLGRGELATIARRRDTRLMGSA